MGQMILGDGEVNFKVKQGRIDSMKWLNKNV